jgi:hypothetical protein
LIDVGRLQKSQLRGEFNVHTSAVKKFSVICFSFAIMGFPAYAATVGASYDADTYYAYQSYSEVRTKTIDLGTFHTGVQILGVDPTYNGHFNFSAVRFDNLSSFTLGEKKYLQLTLKDFKTPQAVDPSYQGPPNYSYLSTGSFQLGIFALSSAFSDSQNEDLTVWYPTNFSDSSKIGSFTMTNAGVYQIDVTSTVNSWITSASTNFGFGLVGTSSTPQAATARFYSMESAGFGPALIPEPEINSLVVFAMASLGCLRSRRRVRV